MKQRIGNDPRNLAWSDDAARFGSAYLSKFGWDPSKGLGVEGEGRTSHLKVSQKLDLYGIGAAHQKDPNGIAWKQNRDFERLLERLNNGSAGSAEDERSKIEGFASATVSKAEALGPAITTTDEDAPGAEPVDTETKRKRKDGGDATDKAEKKRRKKSKEIEANAEEAPPDEPLADEAPLGEEKKGKKQKSKKPEDAAPQAEVGVTTMVVQTAIPGSTSRPVRGHRARFVRSKRMALTNSAAMAEVLGIAPTPTSSSSSAATPAPASNTPSSSGDATPEPALQLEVLTTSSKSVMDYFKEKLAAKATSSSSSSPMPPSIERGDEVPRLGLGARTALQPALSQPEEDPPRRMGLGAFRPSTEMTLPTHTAVSNPTDNDATPEVENQDDKEARGRAKKERKAAKRAAKEALAANASASIPISTSESAVVDGTADTLKHKKSKKSKRRDEELTRFVGKSA